MFDPDSENPREGLFLRRALCSVLKRMEHSGIKQNGKPRLSLENIS